MGRDKATLVFGGVTLAAHAASVLGAVASPCVEVGLGVSGLAAIREDPPGQGPLAAIVAGTAVVGSTSPALVVACDLPRLDADLLRWLRDYRAEISVVPVWEKRPQPLCARWSPSALTTASALVAAGTRSMQALLGATEVALVSPPAELAAGLADVDTPADLDAV
jgi:molybdopterin-guanine dinucleotide biosynthesis protein A